MPFNYFFQFFTVDLEQKPKKHTYFNIIIILISVNFVNEKNITGIPAENKLTRGLWCGEQSKEV